MTNSEKNNEVIHKEKRRTEYPHNIIRKKAKKKPENMNKLPKKFISQKRRGNQKRRQKMKKQRKKIKCSGHTSKGKLDRITSQS